MVWRLTRSYRWVRNRIDELRGVLQPSEHFILVFGFVEKTIRRTFVHVCVSSGMTEEDAVADSKKSDLMRLNSKWKRRAGKSLRDTIGRDAWKALHYAAELRNELIHGRGHRDQRIYKKAVDDLLGNLDGMRSTFASKYGYSGWKSRK